MLLKRRKYNVDAVLFARKDVGHDERRSRFLKNWAKIVVEAAMKALLSINHLFISDEDIYIIASGGTCSNTREVL